MYSERRRLHCKRKRLLRRNSRVYRHRNRLVRFLLRNPTETSTQGPVALVGQSETAGDQRKRQKYIRYNGQVK